VSNATGTIYASIMIRLKFDQDTRERRCVVSKRFIIPNREGIKRKHAWAVALSTSSWPASYIDIDITTDSQLPLPSTPKMKFKLFIMCSVLFMHMVTAQLLDLPTNTVRIDTKDFDVRIK
jgi:hypothetical protein